MVIRRGFRRGIPPNINSGVVTAMVQLVVNNAIAVIHFPPLIPLLTPLLTRYSLRYSFWRILMNIGRPTLMIFS